MKAIFGRKICNLNDLKALYHMEISNGKRGQSFIVTREVMLNDAEFIDFERDFLENRAWITPEDGGVNQDGEIRCIEVVNVDTGEKILVNTEGYNYPRYTGLELECTE